MARQRKGRMLFFNRIPKYAILAGGASLMLTGCPEVNSRSPDLNPDRKEMVSSAKSFKRYSNPERIAIDSRGIQSDIYMARLVSRYKERVLEKEKKEFEGFCWQLKLDCRNKKVRDDYAVAKLLHDMIRTDGILGNMLIEVKDRKHLKRNVGGKIRKIGDDSYKRYPKKMLRDLFSANPRYIDPSGKPFHVFGDCDEFEMAYVTLLRCMGMKARVVMTADNHVNTLVEIGEKEVLVDNRFGLFGLERVCRGRCGDHVGGDKAKKYLRFVNKQALAEEKIMVTREGATRTEDAIRSYLGLEKKGEIN